LHAKTNNSYLILFKRDYEDFIKKKNKNKKTEIFFPPNPMYYVVVLQVAAMQKHVSWQLSLVLLLALRHKDGACPLCKYKLYYIFTFFSVDTRNLCGCVIALPKEGRPAARTTTKKRRRLNGAPLDSAPVLPYQWLNYRVSRSSSASSGQPIWRPCTPFLPQFFTA
jgi:hypothetical protein